MEEVQTAYKDLVKVWHPDRFGDDLKLRAIAEEKLKEINQAFSAIQEHFARKRRVEKSAWWFVGRVTPRARRLGLRTPARSTHRPFSGVGYRSTDASANRVEAQ
jgi:hypothetical protein